MPYFVVKYDMVSFQDGKPYLNLDTAAPDLIGEPFDSYDEANNRANELNAEPQDTSVNITLKNGSTYSGPQYIYRVCTQEF